MKDRELRLRIEQLDKAIGVNYYYRMVLSRYNTQSLDERISKLEHIINKEPHVCKVCNKEMKQK